MNTITVGGCAPRPLSRYLKALGLFRLVAEQNDAHARVHWSHGSFRLESKLSEDELLGFLLEEYHPAPIVAPWNGGSGFYPKDKKTGIEPLSASSALRFESLREAIGYCQSLIEEMALVESPKNEVKREFLTRLRGELPDEALAWIDAAFALTEFDVGYPPLLGTGGNDGRLDFTNNYMQRLVELFDPNTGAPLPGCKSALVAALFGTPTPFLPNRAVGQFDPGSVGGPNATTGFEASSRVNPWDFVLMLEGALLFASAGTRRLQSSRASGRFNYPFTVDITGHGAGNTARSDESAARKEMWLPLWSRPLGYAEVRRLFAEGRLTVGDRIAADGLDAARAVAGLGVDRGIDAFERYAFMMRSGKAYLAVPLNRVRVRRNPSIDLVQSLDGDYWLDRVRWQAGRDNTPARFVRAVNRLEEAVFDLARSRQNPCAIQDTLIAIAGVERSVSLSPTLREKIAPLRLLPPDWLIHADDGSAEFQLAASVAGMQDPPEYVIRSFIYPVRLDPRARRFSWVPSSHRAVYTGRHVFGDMTALLERRLLEGQRDGSRDKPLDSRSPATLGPLAAFLAGQTDDDRLHALIEPLSLVQFPASGWAIQASVSPYVIPGSFAALKLVFTSDATLRDIGALPGTDTRVPVPKGVIRALKIGTRDGMRAALRHAVARLRASGIETWVSGDRLNPSGMDGARAAAALLIPVRSVTTRALLARLTCSSKESEDQEPRTLTGGLE